MKIQPLPRRLRQALEVLSGRAMASASASAARARRSRSAFEGAAWNRFTQDWEASLLAADEETAGSFRVLRARARELERNNPYALAYLELAALNMIGPHGFALQPQVMKADDTLDEDICAEILAGWNDFCGSVTPDGEIGLVELEQLLYRTRERDGEYLVRKHVGFPDSPWDLALEPIDPDLLDDSFKRPAGNGLNEVRLGIEIGQRGRRVGYWLLRPPATIGGTPRERYFVPAEEILHDFHRLRVNQTRGVSRFHAVMSTLRHLDRYELYELLASRHGAMSPGYIYNEHADPNAGMPEEGDGEGGGDDQPGDAPTRGMQIDQEPLGLTELPPGSKLDVPDLKHPNSAFSEFVRMKQRKVSSGLRCGYISLFSDPGAANYSSMRGEFLKDRDRWVLEQARWVRRFRTWVYRAWMDRALLLGEATGGRQGFRFNLRDQSQLYRVRWIARGWESVDELKRVQAAILAVDHGFSTITDELAKEGKDLADIVEKRRKELLAFAEAGVPLQAGADPEVTAALLAGEVSADTGAQGGGNGKRSKGLLETLRHRGAGIPGG